MEQDINDLAREHFQNLWNETQQFEDDEPDEEEEETANQLMGVFL